jgi:hypothetical protein
MANLDMVVKAWDTAHWEMGEAFKGLSDEDVWRRAHPRLLSIGELAAHVGYWEAQSFFGESFETPLSVGAARYYSANAAGPFTLPIGAEELYAELKRIHEACKAEFVAGPKDSEELNPHRENASWGWTIEYQAFHLAYHTGQMYSVRHLLGHETVDN